MKEKSIKIISKDDTMEKTIKYVEEIINDPETISLFHNDAWKIEAAELRGEERGKKEGKEKVIRKMAKKMLLKNFSPKEISELTNLSISEINKLKVD